MNMERVVSICLIVTMIIDVVLPFVLARFYRGFKHKTTALSVLGSKQSPTKNVYNVWCIISGVVFCIFAVVLNIKALSGYGIAIMILLVAYGVGCEIMSGLFPLDSDCEYKDVSSKVHGYGSAIGFTALLFVPLVMGLMLTSINTALAVISFVAFGVAFVFFAFFIMGEKDKFAKTVLRYGGLWQRLVMVAVYAPIIALCIYFLV